MQGDRQTFGDPPWSPTTIPLALFVRPSPSERGTNPRGARSARTVLSCLRSPISTGAMPSVPLSRGTAEERSDDAGGSADLRRPTLVTDDDPPGSLRSPVPLERGTDSSADLRRLSRSPATIPLALFVRPSPLKGGLIRRQTFGDPPWSPTTIPLALFVRPSPLKGGLIPRQTFGDPPWSPTTIPLALFVRPSPLKGGLTLRSPSPQPKAQELKAQKFTQMSSSMTTLVSDPVVSSGTRRDSQEVEP